MGDNWLHLLTIACKKITPQKKYKGIYEEDD